MKAAFWAPWVLAASAALAGCASGLSDADFRTPEPRPVDPALLAMSDAQFNAWDDAQRGEIDDQRDEIQQTYADAEAICWQRFAVNDCITTARRTRRRALEKVRVQELTVNAAERERRTRARLDSLQRKQEQ